MKEDNVNGGQARQLRSAAYRAPHLCVSRQDLTPDEKSTFTLQSQVIRQQHSHKDVHHGALIKAVRYTSKAG